MPKKILAVFDIPEPPPEDGDYSYYLKSKDWEDEADVIEALEANGHEVAIAGVFQDLKPLWQSVQQFEPQLIFNMCETFANRRDQEVNLVGFYELLGIPYTGAGPEALRICRDKSLSKKILSYHRIRIPRFDTSLRRRPKKTLASNMIYPAICKPVDREGSEGISSTSLVKNQQEALDRVQYIHHKLKADAIVEEFISGQEIYMGVMGNERLTVLPPRQLFFRKVEDTTQAFYTYKAKWDEKYRSKWGIESGPSENLDATQLTHLKRVAAKIYRLFQLKGYARIDFRVKESGDIVFLEANPNAGISQTEEFAMAAEENGMSYEALIDHIVNLGLRAAKAS